MTSDPHSKTATVLDGEVQAHAQETLSIYSSTTSVSLVVCNTANYTIEHIKIAKPEGTGLRTTRNRMRDSVSSTMLFRYFWITAYLSFPLRDTMGLDGCSMLEQEPQFGPLT